MDKQNRIWIGTWGNGIYRSNDSLTKFMEIDLVSKNPEKIKDNYKTILDIHHDINNITWLATANGGIVKLVEGNGFKNANKFIKNKELKEHLNFTSIYKDNQNIFLGTLFTGVYHGKDFSNLKQIKDIGSHQHLFFNCWDLYASGLNNA